MRFMQNCEPLQKSHFVISEAVIENPEFGEAASHIPPEIRKKVMGGIALDIHVV